MGRLTKEESARIQGAEWLLYMAKIKGIEEAEKELHWKTSVAIPIGVDKKDAEEAIETIKHNTMQTILCMSLMTLRDEFGFGPDRLTRFADRFNFKMNCMVSGIIDWDDIRETIMDECGINLEIPADCIEVTKRIKEGK